MIRNAPYLLIATENQGKMVEIQALLEGIEVQLIRPSSLGLSLSVLEDGASYAENAAKKAKKYSSAAGMMTLADDSGLEVDALDGRPGIYSARFAPQENATDADRRAYLLSQLAGIPRPWTAHFHCTVALALPTGEVVYATGDCPGEIIPEERGENGFGYDPIFFVPALQKTMAELSMQEKNQFSHRANAIRAAIPTIVEWASFI